MSKIKDIFIMHQKGMEALVPCVQEAIQDVMDAFPQYKNFFPIQNLGNWQSPHAYFYSNGVLQLRPHASVQWYLERSKKRAIDDKRWYERGQLHVGQILSDLYSDPDFQRHPQWRVFLTSQDLYSHDAQGKKLNFCLGCTIPNAFSVISTRRFLDRNNRLNVESFKTVVAHEFGHILGLTEGKRPNLEQALGSHCTNPICVMQQRMSGDVTDVTVQRLGRKAKGLPPVCSDCVIQGSRHLFKHYAAYNNGPNGPNGGR